jgi:hypothetical protein
LGSLGDSAEIIERAVQYLNRPTVAVERVASQRLLARQILCLDGTSVGCFTSLRQFCRDHDMKLSSLLWSSRRGKFHKGYRVVLPEIGTQADVELLTEHTACEPHTSVTLREARANGSTVYDGCIHARCGTTQKYVATGSCVVCAQADRRGKCQARNLRYRFGMTLVDYDARFQQQQGKCAICLQSKALAVDHDHATSEIRGLLCRQCNTALGLIRDDRQILTKMGQYLQAP